MAKGHFLLSCVGERVGDTQRSFKALIPVPNIFAKIVLLASKVYTGTILDNTLRVTQSMVIQHHGQLRLTITGQMRKQFF